MAILKGDSKRNKHDLLTVDYANGFDSLDGLTGNDILWGGDHGDKLNGREGNDYLYGGRRARPANRAERQ